jgi:hypothetical protein
LATERIPYGVRFLHIFVKIFYKICTFTLFFVLLQSKMS